MRKSIKLVSMLIIIAMLSVMAVACGAATGEKTAQTSGVNNSTNADTNTTAASGEKMTLLIWDFDGEKVNPDGYAMNAIRERLGVDLSIIECTNDPAAIKEKLLLQISSGDIPDWWKEVPFDDCDKFADQGVAAEIPLDMIQKYAPNYLKWMEKNLGPDPMHYVRNADGKIYNLPVLWTLASTSEVLGFRKDWLTKVGIAKTPETIDEMEAALTKFRNEDPDGNGKKDTYGITGISAAITNIFSPVFGAYGVYPGATIDVNGKAVRGEVEPGAKDALATLNKWYKSELIDPEFFINKQNNVDDKVISSKVGALQRSWWEFIQPEAFFSGMYYSKLREKIPDADWALSSGPKGPGGSFGITQGNPMLGTGIQFGIQLEKDTDKMAKYLEMFDLTCFDLELYTKIRYGEEGKTYKKGDDGTYSYLPPYDKEEERVKFGIGPWYHAPASFNDYDFQAPFMTRGDLMPVKEAAASLGTGKYDFMAPFTKPVYTEYKDALDQLTIKNFIEFITGKRPLSEFDSFVAEWKKAGGDKVLEEAQAKLDQLNK